MPISASFNVKIERLARRLREATLLDSLLRSLDSQCFSMLQIAARIKSLINRFVSHVNVIRLGLESL